MQYSTLLYQQSLADSDPLVADLTGRERARQNNRIIMIPSESICPAPVLEALGSVFNNVYAEGYCPSLMEGDTEEELADLDFQLVRFRRYADRRFYKGCEYANLVEHLAGRRAAALFATRKNPAENIFVNVQPLSGSAANSAVYDTFVKPGDTVMGLSLMHGGHLTHGSEFNRSGKQYRIVSYEVNRESGRLDYDEIARLANEHRPKMIIAGYTSYPWAPDWKRFRRICDEVGAVLFADVSHPAGMIAAGVYPNPIDYADVTTCTTHKTLFGPRGAIIMTTRKEHADAVMQAVFPGEQGGPHVNKFAAMAVAFKLARTKPFREIQRSIVENARFLGDVLKKNGIGLAYGGTDTHIVLIDLKSVPTSTGFALRGETAVRVLDLAGIVANKNTIPGDTATAEASGIRLGTPWISQRGITREGIEELGSIISRVLTSIRPFSYIGLTGSLPRGKIEAAVLREARERTGSLVRTLDTDPLSVAEPAVPAEPEVTPGASEPENGNSSAHANTAAMLIRGPRAQLFLDRIVTGSTDDLNGQEYTPTLILDKDGTLLAPVSIAAVFAPALKSKPDRRRVDLADTGPAYLLFCRLNDRDIVMEWLDGLADGYVAFDDDIFRKIDGPVVVERIHPDETHVPDEPRHIPDLKPGVSGSDLYRNHPEYFDISKPFFVGKSSIAGPEDGGNREPFAFKPAEKSLKRSRLYESHRALGASMVEFAGWEMPVRYGSIMEEHRAVRERVGLFDISHMGVLEVSGPRATRFLDLLYSNYVPWIGSGESQYGYLLDTDGNVIDDIMLYRRDAERYLVVVNAVNTEVDLAWIRAVNGGSVRLDSRDPLIRAPGPVVIRDLKDELVDLALQGPLSTSLLGKLLSARDRLNLDRLRKNRFITVKLEGIETIVSRTGYTGEENGYELFVHPDNAGALWDLLLKRGKSAGVVPVGLGARDSLRTEAGLPLHGHELAGPYNLSPVEAGFGPYVKLHKPFFIGRSALIARMSESGRTLIRFRVSSRGVRIVKLHDHAVSVRTGRVIGRVTSCAVGSDGLQIGMAWVDSKHAREGLSLAIVAAQRALTQRRGPELETEKKFPLPVMAEIVSRFPENHDITP